MVEWTDVALVAGGVVAGFVNVLAGGGSALTLPLLMLVGLDANQANGTNRIVVLLQSAAGTAEFHRRQIRPWAATRAALPPIVAGAVVGALLATQVSALAMQRLFGVLFLTLAVLMAVRPTWVVHEPTEGALAHPPRLRGAAALFAIGLYGGVFQAGVGIPLLLVIVHAMGADLVSGNAAKTALVTVYTLIVVVIFGVAGQLVWRPALLLSSGAILGSVVGARFAVERGVGFVRKLVMLALFGAGAHSLGLL